MPSHNVQTGIEGAPVGQNQEANEFRPDFTEGSIPLNAENGLIIGNSFGWPSQVNDQSTLSNPHVVVPQPQITSLQSESRGGSIDLRNSVASQAELFSDGHISGSSNLAFPTRSDQAAPSQHVEGQSMQSTVYPDDNAFPFSLQEPIPGGHAIESLNRIAMFKAFYGEHTILKFLFPLTSGIVDLKKEVSKRLNVEVDRFEVKYMDEYEHLISILCDDDLRLCLRSFRGNDEIRVLVLDKVGGTPNFCEKCRSSMQTRA
ncbi:uncharacterized protein LOC131325782 [Rhododendron vialii]|uniref:uncharacterized protein LOC131325782 n=1 Tax=Rhododendron vialii TaxID=182163 RepID=UPI00265D9A98|nr:uncharacterized protein LOC131325782 [Rhododendron vialii]